MADVKLSTTKDGMAWLLNAVIDFDRDVQTHISYGILVYGVLTFCTLAPGFTAPYGRYVNSSALRGQMNFDARIGWLIMELPAFLVPCVILVCSDCPKIRNLPNILFLAFFLIHYGHRWVLCCCSCVQYEPPYDKTNKMACAPSEDSVQPGHPPSLIRVFAVRMKKAWVLSYPLSAQRRLWSDWADAQADLSLRWAHTHFVSFVMSLLNYSSLNYDKRWKTVYYIVSWSAGQSIRSAFDKHNDIFSTLVLKFTEHYCNTKIKSRVGP